MSSKQRRSICVVGAGVIGLSTAVNIIDNIPGITVTLLADKFSPDTTSDVAAGFWHPHALGDTPDELILKWGESTWHHLMKLMVSPATKETGVQAISGYYLFKTPEPELSYSSSFLRCSEMTPAEMSLFGGDHLSGQFCTTVMCQYPMYSSWLLNKFKCKGGKVIKRYLKNLHEIYEDFDIIVNCSGVGANKLVNDSTVQPIKGHLLRVDAPWVKHFYCDEHEDFYIIPGRDYVSLGGTHQTGNWNTEPDKEDSLKIWEGCCKLLPSLKGSTIIGAVSGLRPGRPAVRMEMETVNYNGKKKFIVHNYGHGGGGISLHWGCALDATKMVQSCLGTAKL